MPLILENFVDKSQIKIPTGNATQTIAYYRALISDDNLNYFAFLNYYNKIEAMAKEKREALLTSTSEKRDISKISEENEKNDEDSEAIKEEEDLIKNGDKKK
jgi:hypothetical protein